MIAALYLVLPTLAYGASIPARPRNWWGSEATTTESATAAAASGTDVPVANVTLEGVSNALVNSTETESLLENTNTTVVADITSDSVNITELLQGYDLALLAYPNGTAYIVDENAQVTCTGVDECKTYLENVGVEEISCDGDEDEDEYDDEECEDGEIPETPETPENPNGADGSDSDDTADTPDSYDTPDSPDYGNTDNGNAGSGAAWQSGENSGSSASPAASVIGQNAVATGGNLNLGASATAVAGAPAPTADADAQCDVSLASGSIQV